MTIYIVTSGEYSDYGISAVFTNKEQAELYCTVNFGHEIEEWEADEIKISPADIYKIYEIYFDDKLNKLRAGSHLSVEQERKIQIFKNRDSYMDSDKYLVTIPVERGTPEDKAVKIARDCLFQHLMEQIEKEKAELALRMEALKNES